jgi:hypothetical protein
MNNLLYLLVLCSLFHQALTATTEATTAITTTVTTTAATTIALPSKPDDLRGSPVNTSSIHLTWYQPGPGNHFTILINGHNWPYNSIYNSSFNNNGSYWAADVFNLLVPGELYNVSVNSTLNGFDVESDVTSVYTFPATPGPITTLNQTTDTICIEWIQTGVVEKFSIEVNVSTTVSFVPTPPLNYSIPWSVQTCLQNLTVPGGLYEIVVTAIVDSNLSSQAQ